MARKNKTGWQSYLAKAFLWRWNLLAFGGALLAALISPAPDVVLPIILAAEVTYLGALSGNPKFQKAIAAQEHKDKTKALPKQEDRVSQILYNLSHSRQTRFRDLRERCLEMTRLAAKIRGEHAPSAGDSLHTASLDRMLWVFLRLLVSQQALGKFLLTTDAEAMKSRVTEIEEKIRFAQRSGNQKILRALTDSLATANLRMQNREKANENAQFVDIELDRIEDKIQALVEMSVGHEDPDFISSQVDSVAASVMDTEAAMRDLSFVPGVEEFEETTPAILEVAQS